VARWKRRLLYMLIVIATIAPPVTFLGMVAYTELASDNSVDGYSQCYGCLESFAMVSSDEGWGLGVGQYALHEQHGALAWEQGPDTNGVFQSITSSSPQDVWAVGIAPIWRYRGTQWMTGMEPSRNLILLQASVVSSSEVWAVGFAAGSDKEYEGTILRFDGAQWRQAGVIASSSLEGVSMVSAADGWAVGTRYSGAAPLSGIFVRYQNGAWKTVGTTDGELSAVAMNSPSDGWAVGDDSRDNGVIYRYDGATWQLYATEADVALDSVSVAKTGEAWALGRSSARQSVLYHYAGANWSVVALPRDVVARSLYVGPDGAIWLAGATQQKDRDGFQQGMILQYLAGRWQSLTIPHRPPDGPWGLSPEYRFLAAIAPAQYITLLAFWCTGYVRRRLRFHMTRRELRGALKGDGIALLATFLATLLLWGLYRDSPDAIPSALVIAITMVLAVLLALPTIYLAAPPVLMRGDGTFRWRRRT
jgi:hypothetical protein